MKKLLMTLAAVAAISFVSCGGGKKADTTETAPVTEVEVVEVTETPVSSDVLAKYEEFVEKAIPLAQKMKAGDAAATQEYTKLAEELGKYVQENQAAFASLTEADAKKYQEIAEKFAKALQ